MTRPSSAPPRPCAPSARAPSTPSRCIQALLNTQGGARRNARAEVVGTDWRADSAPLLRRRVRRHDPVPVQRRRQHGRVPHFRPAGRRGRGGRENPLPTLPLGVASEIVYTQGSGSSTVETDPASVKTEANQYVGASDSGMGGQALVKVTLDGSTITNVEVVEHHETAGIGTPAIETIPSAIVEANLLTSTSSQALPCRAAPSSTRPKTPWQRPACKSHSQSRDARLLFISRIPPIEVLR